VYVVSNYTAVDGWHGSEIGTLTKAWTTEKLCFDSQMEKIFLYSEVSTLALGYI
jgi:hypothetical protein